MKRKFAFTIGAIQEVCERCPDHDIERIEELFDENDLVTLLENMAWFISILNKWAVIKDGGSEEDALSMNDIKMMEMQEVKALFADAMDAFKRDQQSETEVTPLKKTKVVTKNKK